MTQNIQPDTLNRIASTASEHALYAERLQDLSEACASFLMALADERGDSPLREHPIITEFIGHLRDAFE